MKRKPPTKRRVVYTCESCKDKPEFVIYNGRVTSDTKKLQKHLRIVHKVKGKLRGRMKLVLALDGADYYNNTFECKVKGVKLIKNEQGPREWPL